MNMSTDQCHQLLMDNMKTMMQDDIIYTVDKREHVTAVRVSALLSNCTGDISWMKTLQVFRLCKDPLNVTITVCSHDMEQGEVAWLVDRRGTWPVYGSPYDLINDQSAIKQVYPWIQFGLMDVTEEVDICLHKGQLLCIELHKDEPVRLNKFDPFKPISQSMFQGSITFAVLSEYFLSKHRKDVPVAMNGPGGKGRANVRLSTDRKHWFVINENSPLIIHLVSILVHVHDQ